MKIALVHPLKHHAYRAAMGLISSGHDFSAVLGIYNNSNLMNELIKLTKYRKHIQGYSISNLDEYVKTSNYINLLFILSKMNNSIKKIYINEFEKYAIKNIEKTDGVYLLQDYCQKVFNYAKNHNKFIIYDHIMPCGFEQRNLLIEESRLMKYSLSYVDNIISEEKIHQNYKNIKESSLVINASNTSYNVAEEALGGINNKKNIIIPYGVNTCNNIENFNEYMFEKFNKIENRKLKILYVGSISLIKGTHYLIKTIDKMVNSDVEFGVVGALGGVKDNTFLDKLIKLKNVHYYGTIPHISMGDIYKDYDIFVFPSLIEGFGMVTLEAMSYGLPCIVNNYCSGVVTDNYDGFIVEARSENEIISKIEYFLNNKSRLLEMSQSAYETSKKCTWEKYYYQIAEMVNSRLE